MPVDDSNLETPFLNTEYSKVATEDSIYVSQSSTNQYSEFLFKDYNSFSDYKFTVTWIGQTTVRPSNSTVYLQVYNHNSSEWETIAQMPGLFGDSQIPYGGDDYYFSTEVENTNFTLTGTIDSNVANYYDVNNYVSCRVYQ